MSKKILITREIPQVGIDMLKTKGFDITVCPGGAGDPPLSKNELITLLKNDKYDAVISLLTDIIDVSIMEIAPTVKIYANYAVGFNNIDLAEAKKRGIAVTNTPGVSSRAVAEHAIALIMALTTRTVEADAFTRAGKYKGWAPMNFIGTDFSEKTLGLIGVGSIGTEVAHVAVRGFNAKIIYYDIMRNEKLEKDYSATYYDSVEKVLSLSDIVSLHVPLIETTHHLINAERLEKMKKTAFLINTSRGPVIDEKALVEALQKKIIAGAALDVFEFEPALTPGLVDLPNVVLTPHIASARENARNEMARIAAQNVIDVLEGKEPLNKVNK